MNIRMGLREEGRRNIINFDFQRIYQLNNLYNKFSSSYLWTTLDPVAVDADGLLPQ